MDADEKAKHYAADSSDTEKDESEREGAHPGADDIIFDLIDVVEEPAETAPFREDLPAALEKEVIRIAEKVAREMFPDIAERIIKEEIEKLKETL